MADTSTIVFYLTGVQPSQCCNAQDVFCRVTLLGGKVSGVFKARSVQEILRSIAGVQTLWTSLLPPVPGIANRAMEAWVRAYSAYGVYIGLI